MGSQTSQIGILLRLIYTCEVSGGGGGGGSGDVRCLRLCVNQMKETEAESNKDAKFGVQLHVIHGQRPSRIRLQPRSQAHFTDVKRPWLRLFTCQAVKIIPQRG